MHKNNHNCVKLSWNTECAFIFETENQDEYQH